jgi:hypothetical protein
MRVTLIRLSSPGMRLSLPLLSYESSHESAYCAYFGLDLLTRPFGGWYAVNTNGIDTYL